MTDPTPLTDEELAEMRRYLADHPTGLRLVAEVERLRRWVTAAIDAGVATK